MSKINNKSIISGLKILSLLAFAVLLMPVSAYADYGANYTYSTFNGYSSNPNPGYYPYNYNPPYQPPVYVAPASAPKKTTVVKSTTTSPTVAYYIAVPTDAAGYNAALASAKPADNTYGSLAANAVYGSNGFLPSGLIQWILFAIFIMIIVILARKVFGSEHKYMETPLKHE